MLGNEATTISAHYLQAGDYLYSATTGSAGTKGYYADITAIAPTADEWLPGALDLTLADGQTVTVMPHDPVCVIGDPRELTRRIQRINAAPVTDDEIEIDEEPPTRRTPGLCFKPHHTAEHRAEVTARHEARRSANRLARAIEGGRNGRWMAEHADDLDAYELAE
ncbi:hypothetical protein [Microtetraspora malaysiensis]|uniref:Uncharacterized protein n=1 Tax=Microtetraspora malaysiensis TaxID=161358 RepID=A0ABW6SKB9_9ACTN